jgi:drug/metabolite transporter (DMT)-like permease
LKQQNLRLGTFLMCLTSFVFSLQDGLSRHLGANYNPYMVVMLRYWFFAVFVIAVAARQPGGIRAAVRSATPATQIFRGFLLVAEIVVIVFAFVHLGLIASHAIFACYPLLVAALSGPVLGERVGWRRWTAIGIGFAGVLIILQPGFAVFSPLALVPILSATMFALYSLLTRYVARKDPASVSFFWTGVAGAALITPFGLTHWQPMAPADWGWMLLLCCTAVTAHFTMIKALEVAEASAIQPFAYLQLVFASAVGIIVFDETIRTNVMTGAAVVVAAGVFTLLRTRRVAAASAEVSDPSIRPSA